MQLKVEKLLQYAPVIALVSVITIFLKTPPVFG